MILLHRQQCPEQLTEEIRKELTAKFIETEESVWQLDYLKQALLELSNRKCCYCETKIDEESKYLEVEHFHHKQKYKNEVLVWDNLLPSCKRCNGTKNKHDTIAEPIIEPTKDNPKEHLKLVNYRFKGKDHKGKMTISVLNLNDTIRLAQVRFLIGSELHDKIEEIKDLHDEYVSGIQRSTIRKNSIIRKVKGLLLECTSIAEYTATSSTVVFSDPDYLDLKISMQASGLWDSDIAAIEDDAFQYKLDTL